MIRNEIRDSGTIMQKRSRVMVHCRGLGSWVFCDLGTPKLLAADDGVATGIGQAATEDGIRHPEEVHAPEDHADQQGHQKCVDYCVVLPHCFEQSRTEKKASLPGVEGLYDTPHNRGYLRPKPETYHPKP